MRQYLKSFLSTFRPKKQDPDASFDLLDFTQEDFECPIERCEKGVYIISATDGTKFIYPNGKKSPIIYIGMSEDLLRRIRDEHYYKGLKHLLDDPNYGIEENIQIASRYQYMYYNGSHVDVFKCRGLQAAKNLESMILNQFYKTYRAIPVGNGARSFEKNS